MLELELSTALSLAKIASTSILEYYATDFVAEEKLGSDNHYEPVTEADREASRIIVEGLAAAFPDDAILSEEETDETELRLSKNRVWIIDPIDGTSGFVEKNGDFAIQIGLAIGGDAVLGVVYQPFHDVMNYATKGEGSFMSVGDQDAVKVHVSDITDFHSMTMAMSRSHATPRIERVIEHFEFGNVARRGSVGLKVSLIASQECDIYIHPSPRTKLWDTCAPQIILEEAGGRLTDIFGGDIRYDRELLPNLNGVLATNGISHDAAVKHLRPVLTEFNRVRVLN